MLSDHEQQAWDELAHRLTAETRTSHRTGERPRDRRSRTSRVPPATLALIGVLVICGLLLVEGAVQAGLALATATGLAWSLWHFWPWLLDDAIVTWEARAGWRDAWQVPAWDEDASRRQLDGDKLPGEGRRR